jgi:hypothetical protein
MSKKKAFALRLDADVLEAVEKWAADEFRSTNGQLEWIIYQALKQAGRIKRKNAESEKPPENELETPLPDESSVTIAEESETTTQQNNDSKAEEAEDSAPDAAEAEI